MFFEGVSLMVVVSCWCFSFSFKGFLESTDCCSDFAGGVIGLSGSIGFHKRTLAFWTFLCHRDI